MLESELENQLGEFHVKMKGTFMSVCPSSLSVVTLDPSVSSLPVGLFQSNGCIVRLFVCLYVVLKHLLFVAGLAGFARLCAGDTYEVSFSFSLLLSCSLPLSVPSTFAVLAGVVSAWLPQRHYSKR